MKRHKWKKTGEEGQERQCAACGLRRRKRVRESVSMNFRAGTIYARIGEVDVYELDGKWLHSKRVPACPPLPAPWD